MFKKKIVFKFLILLFLIALKSSLKTEWEEIDKETGFFPRLPSQNFNLVIFTNGSSEKIINELKNFEKEELLINEKVDLIFIDIVKTPFYKKFYDLVDDKNFLYFFIGNNLSIFENFDHLVNKNNFYEKTYEFVSETINSVLKKIDNFDLLEKEIKEKNIIGIYLGDSDDFEIFQNFSTKNFGFSFFYSFDKELKQKIFKKYSPSKIIPEKNSFIIIRSEKLINEFDNKKLVIFTDLKKEYYLKQFFNFEKKPKFQNCQSSNKIIDSIFYNSEVLLLQINSKIENSLKIKEFEKAIKKLPKKLNFSICNIEDENTNHYLQLFLRSGVSFNPEMVYIIYISPSRNVKILQFADLVDYKIVDFVHEFYRRNYFLFESGSEDKTFFSEEL